MTSPNGVVVLHAWTFKKTAGAISSMFSKSQKKLYCMLVRTGQGGVLEFLDEGPEGGTILSSVKLEEVEYKDDGWIYVRGRNDVESKTSHIRFVGEQEAETEYWKEYVTKEISRRTTADVETAVNEWKKDPAAAEKRYGHIAGWNYDEVDDITPLLGLIQDLVQQAA